jgi:hypothetical protein
MTFGTGDKQMISGQREARQVMIETCLPIVRCVTLGAIRSEVRLQMIRII